MSSHSCTCGWVDKVLLYRVVKLLLSFACNKSAVIFLLVKLCFFFLCFDFAGSTLLFTYGSVNVRSTHVSTVKVREHNLGLGYT